MEEGWAPTGIQIGQYELLNTVFSADGQVTIQDSKDKNYNRLPTD